jgi:hypothetical protein
MLSKLTVNKHAMDKGLPYIISPYKLHNDRLCGLVVIVEVYKHRGPGFDSRELLRIFLRELGLKRGPLSLVIG